MKNWSKTMQHDWDTRARSNALYEVDTFKLNWNEKDFFEKGGREARELSHDFFNEMNFDPTNKRALDIGCGVGRLLREFSKMFNEIYGVDVSDEMIKKATELNVHLKNAKFIKNNGYDLSYFPDKYFDFVYSVVTFQHIPEKEIVHTYISEISRVLKKDGLFKIHIAKKPKYTRIFKYIPKPTYFRVFKSITIPYNTIRIVPDFFYGLYSRIKQNKRHLISTKTYHGTTFTENEIANVFEKNKLTVLKIQTDKYDPEKRRFFIVGKNSET